MPPVCTVGVGLEVSLTCSQTVTYLPPFAVDDSLLQQLTCLLYTSPSPRDATLSRMPSSA